MQDEDFQEDFHLVEHEMHATAMSYKPMVELEIAQSVSDANRTRIAQLESDWHETKAELALLQSLSTKQALVIASLEKNLSSRDTTLQHCTSSLITVNSQYQEAQNVMAQQADVIVKLREQLNEMELQCNIAREDLQKVASEFKAYKQCVAKPRHQAPPQEVMGHTDSKPIKFINNLFEPSMFR
jgi:chromosome segregation ATPase